MLTQTRPDGTEGTAPAPTEAHSAGIPWPRVPLDRADLTPKVGWSAVALLLLLSGIRAWSGSLVVPGAVVVSLACIAFALVALARCWTFSGEFGSKMQAGLLGGIAASIVVQCVQAFMTNPSYGTDSVAFGQYAAELTARGINPYTHSMAPAIQLFNVPVIYHTYLLNGRQFTTMSYPAGSFLFYEPLALLGIHTQAAIIVDAAFWIGSLILLWRLLPRRFGWIAGLILGSEFFTGYVIGGVTDSLFLPFMVLAAWRWDRYGNPGERSAARWIGPVALGVAMAIKQTPWFYAPFFLLGIYLQARSEGRSGGRTALRYGMTGAGAFLLINLPFIVIQPKAWLQGSLGPLTAKMVPGGQGLVNLSTIYRIGGGRLSLFTAAGALFLLLALAAFACFYVRVKRAWMILVVASFFFAPRSFGSYLIMMLPAVLLAAISVQPATAQAIALRKGTHHTLVLGLAGLTALATFGALLTPSPLRIDIIKTRTTGELRSVSEITVQLHNRTGRLLRSYLTVMDNGYLTNFWYPLDHPNDGSVALAAGETKTVTLRAPNLPSMPGVSDSFIVEAFTENPDSVSSSARHFLSPLSVELSPLAVDRPVPVGKTITFVAQLRDRFGRAVHRAGVSVELGQVVYSQSGRLSGEASINKRQEGQSPVSVTTGADGTATFTVVGVQPQRDPVYLQAWISDRTQGPTGYSNQIAVQFTHS